MQAVVLTLVLILAGLAKPGWAAENIAGSVKTVQGAATVHRGTQTMSATAGMHLLVDDVLQTGADSRMGAIFRMVPGSVLGRTPSSKSITSYSTQWVASLACCCGWPVESLPTFPAESPALRLGL